MHTGPRCLTKKYIKKLQSWPIFSFLPMLLADWAFLFGGATSTVKTENE